MTVRILSESAASFRCPPALPLPGRWRASLLAIVRITSFKVERVRLIPPHGLPRAEMGLDRGTLVWGHY
jgi:hypothetical protein